VPLSVLGLRIFVDATRIQIPFVLSPAKPSPKTLAMAEILKSVELRLLRCTLPPAQHLTSPNPVPNPLLEVLIDSIERGNYSDALTSPAARLVFKFTESFEFEDSVESANRFYSEVERSVEAFLRNNKYCGASEAWLSVLNEEGDEDDSRSEKEVELRFAIVMCLGVAALLAFTQQNVTG